MPDESTLSLFTVQKDHDSTVSGVVAKIVVSSMSSLPLDADVDQERTEKPLAGLYN